MKNGSGGWRLLALGCAVVAIVVGLIWLWPRGDEESVDDPAPKAAKPTKVKTRKAHPPVAEKNDPPKRKMPTANAHERKAPTKAEARVEAATVSVAATNGEEIAEADDAPEKKEPMFRHGAEQLLSLATPSQPGAPVPPLPKITDESVAEDLAKAMSDTIRPSPGDSERTLETKLNVAQQKEEFRDLRKEGMTFVEYVNALRDKFNEDAAYLAAAQKLDESLFNDKEVSDKDYKAYREELNKSLRERGLPELEER